MKNLKKGFTLIELLVVIAIIGILATTLAPKLREQLAKAKDAKAVALLGAARTAGSVLLIDKMVADTSTSESIIMKFSEIKDKLDKTSKAMVENNGTNIAIGASRNTDETDGKLAYGGVINIATSAGGIDITGDEAIINFESTAGTNGGTESTEGKPWDEY